MSEYVRGLRTALEIAERQRSKFHARDWDDAITAVMEQIEFWAQVEADREAAKASALAKLQALGLTEQEAAATAGL